MCFKRFRRGSSVGRSPVYWRQSSNESDARPSQSEVVGYLDRPAVVHRSTLNTHTWRSFVGIIDIYVRTTRPLIVSFRRNTHTSTMQNSVLEPASHGTDFVIAVVPSVFVDTTFRRKDCTRPRGGNSRSTTSAEKARHVERMNPSTGM